MTNSARTFYGYRSAISPFWPAPLFKIGSQLKCMSSSASSLILPSVNTGAGQNGLTGERYYFQ